MMQRGQASLELLALLPIIVGAALVAVQVAGMLAASSAAQDRARERAMQATGRAGTVLTVTGTARAPRLPGLPGAAPDGVRVVASVRAP